MNDSKQIGLLLPDKDIDLDELQRVQYLIEYYFKTPFKALIYILEDSIEYYKNHDIEYNVITTNGKIFDNNEYFNNIDSLVIMRDKHNNNPSFKWSLNINVYKPIMFGHGGLRQISGEFKKSKETIFHANSKTEYIEFPYTFLYSLNVFNDENSLGFRIPEDISYLEDRDKSHIVIAVFGGSAAYDLTSKESFSVKLEKLLNHNLKNKKITVLNFGMCAGLILNEIMIYMLFVWKINPDIVVSYSGFNDFLMGQFSDTNLQKKYHIAYAHIYKEWQSKLHNIENLTPYKIETPSDIIIKSYYDRQKQFEELVLSRGKVFISVLQPTVYSKKCLAKTEKHYLNITKNKDMEMALFNINVIYKKYLAFINSKEDLKYFFDMHTKFKKFGNKDILFSDTVHTINSGSEIIAKELSKFIEGVLNDKV